KCSFPLIPPRQVFVEPCVLINRYIIKWIMLQILRLLNISRDSRTSRPIHRIPSLQSQPPNRKTRKTLHSPFPFDYLVPCLPPTLAVRAGHCRSQVHTTQRQTTYQMYWAATITEALQRKS